MKFQDKFISQVILCLTFITLLRGTGIVNVGAVAEFKERIQTEVERNYSFEDIVSAGTKLTDFIIETPDAISAAITVANEISQNGQPIDKDEKNPIKSVHSIAGGKVIYAGIDKQLGLCVRIKHEEKISTYGNLYTLTVVPGERVKRSDIIGTYNSEKDKEFYYHLEDSVL